MGLFSLHAGHSAHNFPGKLLGYMANQKPILGSINLGNDLEQIVCGANAGFISVNGDDELLLANARQLLNSSELRSCMGKSGKLLLNDTFSVNAAASLLLKSINR